MSRGSDAAETTAGCRRLAKLLGGPYAERPSQLDRALGAEPEVAAQADELRRHLPFELLQLGDLAGLHELAQPRLDAPADSSQLAHPPGPQQLLDRDPGRADRLGGTPVRARRVGIRLDELEQRGERVEAIGDLGVLHRAT
jgi:hypothetical protein